MTAPKSDESQQTLSQSVSQSLPKACSAVQLTAYSCRCNDRSRRWRRWNCGCRQPEVADCASGTNNIKLEVREATKPLIAACSSELSDFTPNLHSIQAVDHKTSHIARLKILGHVVRIARLMGANFNMFAQNAIKNRFELRYSAKTNKQENINTCSSIVDLHRLKIMK